MKPFLPVSPLPLLYRLQVETRELGECLVDGHQLESGSNREGKAVVRHELLEHAPSLPVGQSRETLAGEHGTSGEQSDQTLLSRAPEQNAGAGPLVILP